jgi:hypothetical protein
MDEFDLDFGIRDEAVIRGTGMLHPASFLPDIWNLAAGAAVMKELAKPSWWPDLPSTRRGCCCQQ